ncbi:2-oxo acid dehydrogenase acyltransferase [Stylonychia lemnae]|uniref:2-oxo acid dehydrogenase acyltransferase n=1 Tax=Stylonychia lemnae TaxID=5949 RepID=A0A077ZTB5_STYLE|nr:2-oxo acid dehydrogenase acyltransferase [Stylonychia lemnae]CDW72570.1 2-oxo acid dehydrogenase acyltransferase [Stylonychia lemnae]|eukprot:CDW71716.1 2-oxo acid dehydrogenase acyltransferase [Stylonychia lemnae]
MTKAIFLANDRNRRDVGRIRWGYVIRTLQQQIQFQKAEILTVSVLVDQENGKDLLSVNLQEAQNESLLDLAKVLGRKVVKAKNNQDEDHIKATQLFDIIPNFILGVLITIFTYLGQCVGISIPALGLRGNEYGQALLTNIGTLGFEEGFAPIAIPFHSMYTVCSGKVIQRVVVMNGEIKIRDIMKTVWTIDHRYGDAAIAGRFVKIFKDYVENPQNFDISRYPDCSSLNSTPKNKNH